VGSTFSAGRGRDTALDAGRSGDDAAAQIQRSGESDREETAAAPWQVSAITSVRKIFIDPEFQTIVSSGSSTVP
jgi:hypothetical protein